MKKRLKKLIACNAPTAAKIFRHGSKPRTLKRISKYLKLRESEFIDKYLKVDDEGDFVAKTLPCPFLGADNYCSIYDQRPSDCRRFPYTDEDVFIKRPQLTQKNTTFCPITYFVIEKLIEAEKSK
ncbi:MAG: YkgJ family cysteine cluster protein [Chitinophagaceae bacterium]